MSIPLEIQDRITVEIAWQQYFEWPVPPKRFTTRWVRALPVSDILEIFEYAGSLIERGQIETGDHLGRLITALIGKKTQPSQSYATNTATSHCRRDSATNHGEHTKTLQHPLR